MTHSILIVDDDEEIRTQMKWALSKDYDVAVADDRESAIRQFSKHQPMAVLLDLGLPPHPNDPREGFVTLQEIMSMDSSAKVIIISGQGDRQNARRAVGCGAYDFHTKPVDMEELRITLQRCVYVAELDREYRETNVEEGDHLFEGILGSSSKMRNVFSTISKVATSDAPVLILGESGTGKEMVANAIHRRSPRGDRPFVALNCSAIPENLIESELFGHEKGAFTGAHAQRQGLIETASSGTLFLDEIGDLPSPVQVKLLRFLQERKVQRVGGREELDVDTRIVAATNVDLDEAIKSGTFREDLYFRLAVVICQLPALRERGEDILLLANSFLENFGRQNRKPNISFDSKAERAILSHQWPGNVRELQNRVQRAVIMADEQRIRIEDLELKLDGEGKGIMTLKEAKLQIERELVGEAIKRHGGNISAAASELGVSRPTIYELIDKLNIDRKKG